MGKKGRKWAMNMDSSTSRNPCTKAEHGRYSISHAPCGSGCNESHVTLRSSANSSNFQKNSRPAVIGSSVSQFLPAVQPGATPIIDLYPILVRLSPCYALCSFYSLMVCFNLSKSNSFSIRYTLKKLSLPALLSKTCNLRFFSLKTRSTTSFPSTSIPSVK